MQDREGTQDSANAPEAAAAEGIRGVGVRRTPGDATFPGGDAAGGARGEGRRIPGGRHGRGRRSPPGVVENSVPPGVVQ